MTPRGWGWHCPWCGGLSAASRLGLSSAAVKCRECGATGPPVGLWDLDAEEAPEGRAEFQEWVDSALLFLAEERAHSRDRNP